MLLNLKIFTYLESRVMVRMAINHIIPAALAYHDVAESLSALRSPIDKLEEVVDNRLWPLPKYRELLFIS